jgi:hypothetical protein
MFAVNNLTLIKINGDPRSDGPSSRSTTLTIRRPSPTFGRRSRTAATSWPAVGASPNMQSDSCEWE